MFLVTSRTAEIVQRQNRVVPDIAVLINLCMAAEAAFIGRHFERANVTGAAILSQPGMGAGHWT